jgi:hypothetical protein
MYRGRWRVPRLGGHPRDYWLNRKRIRLRSSEVAVLTKRRPFEACPATSLRLILSGSEGCRWSRRAFCDKLRIYARPLYFLH